MGAVASSCGCLGPSSKAAYEEGMCSSASQEVKQTTGSSINLKEGICRYSESGIGPSGSVRFLARGRFTSYSENGLTPAHLSTSFSAVLLRDASVAKSLEPLCSPSGSLSPAVRHTLSGVSNASVRKSSNGAPSNQVILLDNDTGCSITIIKLIGEGGVSSA